MSITTEFRGPGELVDGDLSLSLDECFPGDPTRNYVPAYRFHMISTRDRVLLGRIELRLGDNEFLQMYAGQIGYGVEPEHRGHRYAARSCRLVLPLALAHGVNPLWITCNPDNWASRKTCERAGAELVEIVDLPEDCDMYQSGERQKCRYRIALPEVV